MRRPAGGSSYRINSVATRRQPPRIWMPGRAQHLRAALPASTTSPSFSTMTPRHGAHHGDIVRDQEVGRPRSRWNCCSSASTCF